MKSNLAIMKKGITHIMAMKRTTNYHGKEKSKKENYFHFLFKTIHELYFL
jgi:hypothetical protein